MQCKQEKVLILSVDQPRIKVGLWQRRSGNTEHCVAKGEAANFGSNRRRSSSSMF